MNKICDIFGHNYVRSSDDKNSAVYSRNYTHVCSRKGCEKKTDYPLRDKWNNTVWDSDVWEYIKITLIALAASALLFIVVWAIINVGAEYSCNGYKDLGINVQYSWRTGCMALHEKFGWVPVTEYFRVINLNIP